MIAASVIIAASFSPCFSYRVATRRNGVRRLISRSTPPLVR